LGKLWGNFGKLWETLGNFGDVPETLGRETLGGNFGDVPENVKLSITEHHARDRRDSVVSK
jgi:hypothetical protein